MSPRVRKAALTSHVIAFVGWLGARAAVRGQLDAGSPHAIRVQLPFDASAAIVAHMVTTALSDLKPKGLTRRSARALAKMGTA